MAKVRRKSIIISPEAKHDIDSILMYLKEHWNQKTIDTFLSKLEFFKVNVSINPRIFGYYSKSRNIRNFAISKQQVVYYRNKRKQIEIMTVFDTRQSPASLKQILRRRR